MFSQNKKKQVAKLLCKNQQIVLEFQTENKQTNRSSLF